MRHIPEGRAIDIAVHKVIAKKLRVVEGVERFEPEFQRFRLGQLGELVNRNLAWLNSPGSGGGGELFDLRSQVRSSRQQARQRR